MQDVDGETIQGIRDETADDSILLDGSDGTVATINGAIATATTSIVVDTVSGDTIVVGQVVTVKGGAASITDDAGNTDVSTDMHGVAGIVGALGIGIGDKVIMLENT